MPHIHTKPGQHDLTASAMIVRTDGDVPRALLVNHKKYHKYIQPGGHVELHENPWQAVLHEIEEETGYEISQLQPLQPKDSLRSLSGKAKLHPIPISFNTHLAADGHYHMDMIFLFTADQPPANKPQEGESQDLIWMSASELAEMDKDSTFPDVREIFQHAFEHYLPHWEATPIDRYM